MIKVISFTKLWLIGIDNLLLTILQIILIFFFFILFIFFFVIQVFIGFSFGV